MTRPGSVLLEDVGKRYIKYDDIPLLLTRAARLRAGHKRTHLWAVRHVDLAVEPGETVGVIGRNGSGKSTMLRMLAGVTAPTEGGVVVRGRVAPLIAVGVGFHPELTGRENVYVNATVLGMRRREIDALFDSILDFAELEEFVDTPVKFYSSGMFVRLGFAVAVASRPDVLLIDEVLAVGDLAFQTKCFDRMEEIRTQGTSVLVVSHNLNSVRLLCKRTMVLHNGEAKFLGETDKAISLYHDLLAMPLEEGAGVDGEAPRDAPVTLRSFTLLGPDGAPTNHVKFGDEMTFVLDVEFSGHVSRPAFSFVLANERQQIIYSDYAHQEENQRSFEAGERARFVVKVRATLPTGSYKVRAGARWGLGTAQANRASRYVTFFVSGRPLIKGIADLDAKLAVEGGRSAGGDGKLPEPIESDAV